MLRRELIGIRRLWLITTRRSTISIGLVYIMECFLLIVHWRRLLPKWLIISIWLLPPLIVPSLMQAFIVVLISYNIIVTTLLAKRVRIHSSKRK
ncbi:hypothetical protein AHAS_Ahas20G0194000 [Arachis hypogaea]